MKMFKKLFAVVLCVAMLASSAAVMSASAEEASGALTGLRWFPVPAEKQNDDAWEVECVADGCLCQRFTETAEDTGNSNYLDTTYDENGALTLARNDVTVMQNDTDVTGWYWPRIRTVSLETSPEFDLKTANTLYYDIEAFGSSQWNVTLSFNGMVVSLGRFMAEAAGATGMDPNSPDAPAGAFKGSINLNDTIDKIAADTTHGDNVNAVAIKNMKKCFVPQVQIYVVGDTASSIVVRELYVSTADDTTGANCTFVDMGLLTGLGEEYYEAIAEDEPADEPAEGDEPADEPADEPTEGDETEEDTTTTTTKKADKSDKDSGSALPIIIIVAAVVVVVAVVIVIVLKKKKA